MFFFQKEKINNTPITSFVGKINGKEIAMAEVWYEAGRISWC